MNEPKILSQIKCPICGKKFFPAPQHAWLIGVSSVGRRVCSYTCMRNWEKANKLKTRDEGGRRITK